MSHTEPMQSTNDDIHPEHQQEISAEALAQDPRHSVERHDASVGVTSTASVGTVTEAPRIKTRDVGIQCTPTADAETQAEIVKTQQCCDVQVQADFDREFNVKDQCTETRVVESYSHCLPYPNPYTQPLQVHVGFDTGSDSLFPQHLLLGTQDPALGVNTCFALSGSVPGLPCSSYGSLLAVGPVAESNIPTSASHGLDTNQFKSPTGTRRSDGVVCKASVRQSPRHLRRATSDLAGSFTHAIAAKASHRDESLNLPATELFSDISAPSPNSLWNTSGMKEVDYADFLRESASDLTPCKSRRSRSPRCKKVSAGSGSVIEDGFTNGQVERADEACDRSDSLNMTPPFEKTCRGRSKLLAMEKMRSRSAGESLTDNSESSKVKNDNARAESTDVVIVSDADSSIAKPALPGKRKRGRPGRIPKDSAKHRARTSSPLVTKASRVVLHQLRHNSLSVSLDSPYSLSPSTSQLSVSGAESDRDCFVVLERLRPFGTPCTRRNEGKLPTRKKHKVAAVGQSGKKLQSLQNLRGRHVQVVSRGNTNSEYEPLPIPHVLNKRKRLACDMGYSQPRKRRKRKGLNGSYLSSSQDESCVEESLDCATPSVKRNANELPKKRYQKAGLYSNSFKSEKSSQDSSGQDWGLLPAPLHVGKYLMKSHVDFELPYDIWWQHTHQQLKPVKVCSPKYKKIRYNVYVDCRPLSHCEVHQCTCRRPITPGEKGCGDLCLNRMIYTECNPGTCPSGDLCSNQRIQRHEWLSDLEKFATVDRGLGVRAKHCINSGTFIIEYVGEVITETEFQDRMSTEYSQERHHYCLHLDSGLVIDGYKMGNVCRFVNHACEPNCEMQKWNVNGTYRMGLFALRDISPGVELTYDYKFYSYNKDSEQQCRCGSENCRGAMGGRFVQQRNNGSHKDRAKSPRGGRKGKQSRGKQPTKAQEKVVQRSQNCLASPPTPSRPMSQREVAFARRHRVLLVRNLHRVGQSEVKEPEQDPRQLVVHQIPCVQDPFHTQLMALNTARTTRTRGLASALDNPEMSRMAYLAQSLQIILISVATYTEDGVNFAEPLRKCPSKRSHPEYYQLIKEPIDLDTIEKHVMSGWYSSMDAFEADFLLLFKNVETYCGIDSEVGQAVGKLRKVYTTAKQECLKEVQPQRPVVVAPEPEPEPEPVQPEPVVDGSEAGSMEVTTDVETVDGEEVIRCVCNIFREEGKMIECEKCQTWQHMDCMGIPENDQPENYLCERCDPRPVSKEVLLTPPPTDAKEGLTYYLTLMRDDEGLQVRVDDTFYVYKDPESPPPLSHSELMREPQELLIYRVESLWKDQQGEKFALGHYYIRPHETFHEPNRKFFLNEVFRIPRYEIVPLHGIVGECCVLDLPTYCKGRPRHIPQSHVYVCEYRVDKTAHSFSKITKWKQPVNTRSYCFLRLEQRLNPRRTYIPHEVPDGYIRKGSKAGDSDRQSEVSISNMKPQKVRTKSRKVRLEHYLQKLISSRSMPNPLDASYLLKK